RTAPKLMYSFLPIVIAVPPSNAASIAGTTPDLPFADDSGLLVVRLEFDFHHPAAFFAGRLKLPLLDRILCGADQQRMASQGFGALHRPVGRDYDHQPYPAADVAPPSQLRIVGRYSGLYLADDCRLLPERSLRTDAGWNDNHGEHHAAQTPTSPWFHRHRPSLAHRGAETIGARILPACCRPQ